MDSSNEAPEIDLLLCMNCNDALNSVYIECAECNKKTVILCVQCFSTGAEIGTYHKRGHNYRVKTAAGTPLFEQSMASTSAATSSTSQWTSQEEVALLKAVERYNMGNWEEVADQINPKRSLAEVKQHYDLYYLRGRIGQISTRGFRRPVIEDESSDLSQLTCTPGGTCHYQTTRSNTAQPTIHSQMSPPIKPSVCKVNSDDLLLLAYMPLRDDFEKEWNNDAEEMVSNLLLGPDDDELDREVKSNLLDAYVSVSAKRRQLKALARDYDLVPEFFKKEKPSIAKMRLDPAYAKVKKQEEQLREEFKRYAQFLPSKGFNEMIAGLLKEQRLKNRIDELQELKKDGVTSLEGRKAKFTIESPKRKFKRGRRRMQLDYQTRKGNLRWQRLQRWQKKLLDD